MRSHSFIATPPGATKISKGVYEYNGYRISNCGYHAPDHCIWWKARTTLIQLGIVDAVCRGLGGDCY